MKLLSFSSLITLLAIVLITACGNDGDAARDAALENAGSNTAAPSVTPNDASVTPPPATPEPAQNAAGVWHYTCPSGCEGGAGAAGPCPKCGATLAHNTAYHQNTDGRVIPSGNANLTPVPKPDLSTPTAPPKPEPAQNAAGVWHYTCPSGCAGGAGTAIACSKCGATLAHNTAYHQ